MGNEESSLELSKDEENIIVKDENITSISCPQEREHKIIGLKISKAKIKKLNNKLPNLLVLCYNYSDISKVPRCICELSKNSKKIESLDFNYNDLKTFPTELLEVKSLQHVTLFNNKIREINLEKTNAAFIDLGYNELTEIPESSKELKSLILDNNKITKIDKPNSFLLKLSLRCNLVKEISNVVFENLAIIDLSNNHITTLPDMKKCFPNLKELEISCNKIKKLTEFPPFLEKLDASFNFIKSIPESIQDTALIEINLSYNLIEFIPKLPETLYTLNVCNNKINKFEPMKLPKLRHLYIKKNSLEGVPDLQETTVIRLSFASNMLKMINYNSLLEMISELDLSDNQLTELPEYIVNMPRLVVLTAVNNRIKTITDSISSTHLISLNLSHNPIEKFPKLPMTLERLILTECSISSADFYDEDNEELIELYLSNNSLETITFLPWFQTVKLSRNKFKVFPEINYSLRELDLSCNQLTNVTINDNERLTLLDLSYNNLKELKIKAQSLTVLKLNNNSELNCFIDRKKIPMLKEVEFINCDCIKLSDFHISHILSNEMLGDRSVIYQGHPKAAAFSSIKGDNSASDDVMTFIKEIRKDTSLICLFDGSSTHKTAVLSARTAITAFDQKNPKYAGRTLDTLTNKIIHTVNEQRNFDLHEMCFVFVKKNNIEVNIMGQMVTYIISNDGKIRNVIRFGDEGEFGESSISLIMPVSYEFGTKLFNTNVKLRETDKWIIVASSSFARVVPDNVVELVAQQEKESCDFAYRLRNIGYSYSQSNNISVFVTNLSLIK